MSRLGRCCPAKLVRVSKHHFAIVSGSVSPICTRAPVNEILYQDDVNLESFIILVIVMAK